MASLRTGIFLVFVTLLAFAAETVEVVVLDRQNHDTNYTYVIPASSTSDARTNINCSGIANTVNCSSATSTTTNTTPAVTSSYQVRGATFELGLPDGRIAIVNCESKANMTDFSRMDQMRRSCRVPLVNKMKAEFNGDKAKLSWSVSIDGKKFESETYKILGVLDKNN
jgi:hypothetical protein